MTDTTPLCRDCAHYCLTLAGTTYCDRPVGASFNPVQGERTHTLGANPYRERNPDTLLDFLFHRTRCGPLGLYFKPRGRPSTPPPPMGGTDRYRKSDNGTKTASYRRGMRKIASLDTSRSSLDIAQDIARKALKK